MSDIPARSARTRCRSPPHIPPSAIEETEVYKLPEVTNIPVECLYSHPDNPRKDLGDLTELAASIKANGIFQNLTVVPVDNVESVLLEHFKAINAAHSVEEIPNGRFYVVIIGHRRLAAAKLAGMSAVPCTIVEMSPQEQVRAMLIENMQRAELTPYEQAQGFQMMLNMGDSVETIAKDSGFSETTIRRRVKLLAFDDQTFREATAKQITLDTLSEVAKIENAKKRDQILASYGSNNFTYTLQDALAEQMSQKNAPAAKAEILNYAQQIKEIDYSKHQIVLTVRLADYTPGSATPKKLKGEYYAKFDARYAYVVQKKPKAHKTKRTPEELDLEAEIRRRETELTEITGIAYTLRRAFIENLTVSKTDYPLLIEQAAKALVSSKVVYSGGGFQDMFAELMGVTIPEGSIPSESARVLMTACGGATNDSGQSPHSIKALLYAIYAAYGDQKSNGYWRRSGYTDFPRHYDNPFLNMLYDFLCAFGYELSEVEQSQKDGTHPLFAKETKDTGEAS